MYAKNDFQLTPLLPIMERFLLYFCDVETHILSDKLAAEMENLSIFQWGEIMHLFLVHTGAFLTQ